MEIGRIIDNIVFFGRKPPEAIKWEELRKKILKAIDEERERGAIIITSPSNIGYMVYNIHELTGSKHHTHEMEGYIHTADEDSFVYEQEDGLKITVA